ncbi:MAG: amidohydrolase family protein [Aggregatilineales bacterium]
MGVLFKNGTIITADAMFKADLLVEGEQISCIATQIDAAEHKIVDCAGRYLMPGGIDVHTHLHLPLGETSANSGYIDGHQAAAFGGTTTHIDFVSQPIGGTFAEGLAQWRRKAIDACIDYGFHMTLTDPRPDVIASIPGLLEQGINTIKVLMAYKGSFMVDDTGILQAMRACEKHGMLVMTHCENGDAEAFLRENLVAEGKLTPNFHADSRPAALEAEATNRAIMMSEITGCPLYIVHMTCNGAIDALRRGRSAGLSVMGESCPQYFFFTADEHLNLPDFEAAKYVCSPPIRTPSDQDTLWKALSDGTLQVIATDHCDFWLDGGRGDWQSWAAKHDNQDWDVFEAQQPDNRRPGKELGRDDFTRIPNGLPGIEDRMHIMWHYSVNSGRITPSQFVALHCTNPARIFGMASKKGALIPGADADILVWNPETTHTISAKSHHMRTDYNCYEGVTVRGKAEQVYLRGRKIVDGDTWLGETGAGQFVPRGATITVL